MNQKNLFRTVVLLIALLLSLNSANVNAQICSCVGTPCTGSLFSDNYSTPGNWTYITGSNSVGSMVVTGGPGGVMHYVNPKGSDYNRMYQAIPGLSSATSFTAECKIKVMSGNSPGHYVMAFTDNSSDPLSTNATGYPLTNNDALWVTLQTTGSPTGPNCCTNPTNPNNQWGFLVNYKDNTTYSISTASPFIFLPALNTWYYVRLIRSSTCALLAVYSDAAFSINIPGSPVCIHVPATCGNFGFVQQGVVTWASSWRRLNARVDNLRLCSGFDCSGTIPCNTFTIKEGDELIEGSGFVVYPNPTEGNLQIDYMGLNDEIVTLELTNASGQILFSLHDVPAASLPKSIDITGYPKGIYILRLVNNKEVTSRIIAYQ